MLRVSKVEEWLRRAPARPDLGGHGDCVIMRAEDRRSGGAGISLVPGAAAAPGADRTRGADGQAAGSPAPWLDVIMIPPGTRGLPHFRAESESAIYTVSGEAEIWHGDGLVKRTVVRAGDFMYVPPGTAYLAVNRGDVMMIAVSATAGPEEREDVVVVGLPRHLADLVSVPVAVRQHAPDRPASRGEAA
jgi:uncharacterized RmlC-like cupin family protein